MKPVKIPSAVYPFRPNPKDRASIHALQQHLGGDIKIVTLLRMGLDELLKKHGLQPPEPTPAKPKKQAIRATGAKR